MEAIISLILEIDPKILTIAAIVLVVLFILSLIKKMIKLGIAALLIGAILFYAGPMVKDFQEKYDIHLDDGTIYMTVDGNTSEFSLTEWDSIAFEDVEGTNNCEIIINPNTDNEKTFEIPNIMKIAIKGFANSNDIEVVE